MDKVSQVLDELIIRVESMTTEEFRDLRARRLLEESLVQKMQPPDREAEQILEDNLEGIIGP